MSFANVTTIRRLNSEEMDRFAAVRATAYRIAPEIADALYSLRPMYAEGLNTWAVDAKGRVYISFEGWAGTWTVNQRAFVLIHEVWHWLRRHPQRTKAVYTEHPEWVGQVWMKATDMEINDDIARIPDADLPEGCVYPQTDGLPEELVAEEYARLLTEKQEEEASEDGDQDGEGSPSDGDQDGNGGSGADGQGQGQPGNGSGESGHDHGAGSLGPCADVPDSAQDQADSLDGGISEGLRDHIEKAVAREIKNRAEKSIGRMTGSMRDWAMERLAPPKVDWRRKMRVSVHGQIIAVKGHARDSYSQPNRRHQDSSFIIPGRRATDPNVIVGIDKSGSMLGGDLEIAVSEATGVLRSRGVKKIRVMDIDVMVGTVSTQRGRKLGALDNVGGGTDMRVAYKAIYEMNPRQRPTNFILLTDGYTPWPDEADRVPGVQYLVGIICGEAVYEKLAEPVPAWITPVHIPRGDDE